MASLSQQDERLPKGIDLIWLTLGQRSIEKALKLLSEVCELWGVCWLKGALCCSAVLIVMLTAARRAEGRVGSTPSQPPGSAAAAEGLAGQWKPYSPCQMCSQQGSGFLFKIQSLQEHIGVLKLNQ